MTEEEQVVHTQEEQELEQHEDEQVLHFFREYGMPILVGVAAALILYLGYVVYQNYKSNMAERAAQSLLAARSAQDLETILSRYAATPSGPVALLTLASTYLHGGQSAMAREAYARFEREYPEHIMSPMAEIGLAYCAEAEGNLEEALNRFTQFVEKHPLHFLAPQATLSRARCMEQMERYAEAKAVYEDYIAGHPDSRWVPQAETALLYVDKAMRTADAQ